MHLLPCLPLVPRRLVASLVLLSALGPLVLYTACLIKRAVEGGVLEGIKAFWDRDILAFFLIGCTMFGVGLLGEYVGRISQQVRERPRYVIRAVLEHDADEIEPPHPAAENVRVMR